MTHNIRKSMCGPWGYKPFMRVMEMRHPKRGNGSLKFLILMSLQEQPRHGYGIIQAIEEKRGYAPSPGVVYPTLQLLQDQGFVNTTEQEDRKIYALTDEGRRYLQENSEVVDRINAWLTQPKWNFVPGIGKRIGALTGTIFSNYCYLDEDKIKRIEDMLDETRKRIGEIIFEKQTG